MTESATLHQAVGVIKRHHVKQVVVTDEIDRAKGILTGADIVTAFQ